MLWQLKCRMCSIQTRPIVLGGVVGAMSCSTSTSYGHAIPNMASCAREQPYIEHSVYGHGHYHIMDGRHHDGKLCMYGPI